VLRVRFLGTGPAGGRPGRGHSGRMESSLVVTSPSTTILVDVTRDFAAQVRGIDRLDLVLVTHAHRDASGGVVALDRWLRAPVPLFASRHTIRTLRARHHALSHVTLRAVPSGATIAERQLRVTPLLVPHAPDCSTFAWRIEHGGVALVYASDIARLTAHFAEFCAGCDLLVLDGAMWGRSLYTHLELHATAPIVAGWPVRRILFTQLGRSTPPHAVLDRYLRAIDSRIGAAYDGLELAISPTRAPRCTARSGARAAPMGRRMHGGPP